MVNQVNHFLFRFFLDLLVIETKTSKRVKTKLYYDSRCKCSTTYVRQNCCKLWTLIIANTIWHLQQGVRLWIGPKFYHFGLIWYLGWLFCTTVLLNIQHPALIVCNVNARNSHVIFFKWHKTKKIDIFCIFNSIKCYSIQRFF